MAASLRGGHDHAVHESNQNRETNGGPRCHAPEPCELLERLSAMRANVRSIRDFAIAFCTPNQGHRDAFDITEMSSTRTVRQSGDDGRNRVAARARSKSPRKRQ